MLQKPGNKFCNKTPKDHGFEEPSPIAAFENHFTFEIKMLRRYLNIKQANPMFVYI